MKYLKGEYREEAATHGDKSEGADTRILSGNLPFKAYKHANKGGDQELCCGGG